MIASRPFSRYATPPLDSTEKSALLCALGLGSVTYRFLEFAGDVWLSGKEARGVDSRTLLAQPENDDGLTAVSRYPSEELPVLSPDALPSLWKRIFPAPFHRLRCAEGSPAKLELRPPVFQAAVDRLSNALNAIEARLSMTELSCLYVSGPSGDFPLLLHFVRHRCIRAGTHPSLEKLGAWRGSGSEGAVGLKDLFKTSATLAFVDNPVAVPGVEGLAAAAAALEATLQDPSRWLGGAPVGEAATSYELGL